MNEPQKEISRSKIIFVFICIIGMGYFLISGIAAICKLAEEHTITVIIEENNLNQQHENQ